MLQEEIEDLKAVGARNYEIRKGQLRGEGSQARAMASHRGPQ